jgi:hypothetical protein
MEWIIIERIRMLKYLKLKKIGLYGSTFAFPDVFESYDIEQTNNRFVAIPNSVTQGF